MVFLGKNWPFSIIYFGWRKLGKAKCLSKLNFSLGEYSDAENSYPGSKNFRSTPGYENFSSSLRPEEKVTADPKFVPPKNL